MIDLYDKATDRQIGSITEAELAYLDEMLEEESARDQDYYLTADTISLLGTDGRATDHLLSLLRGALGANESVEIRWQRR